MCGGETASRGLGLPSTCARRNRKHARGEQNGVRASCNQKFCCTGLALYSLLCALLLDMLWCNTVESVFYVDYFFYFMTVLCEWYRIVLMLKERSAPTRCDAHQESTGGILTRGHLTNTVVVGACKKETVNLFLVFVARTTVNYPRRKIDRTHTLLLLFHV